MIGLVLAAGTGSRLGDRTQEIPKALIRVADRTLLDRTLQFLGGLKLDRIVVVTGFQSDQVQAHLKNRKEKHIISRLNADYRKGNLLSLLAAQSDLDAGFVVCNVDHIYPEELLSRFPREPKCVTAFCDFDRELGPDDMKIQSRDRLSISAISKKLTTYDGGYIGCTVVPAKNVGNYLTAVGQVQAKYGEGAVVEQVLNELAQGNEPPAIADTSGIRWFEVDDENDLRRADLALKNGDTPNF